MRVSGCWRRRKASWGPRPQEMQKKRKTQPLGAGEGRAGAAPTSSSSPGPRQPLPFHQPPSPISSSLPSLYPTPAALVSWRGTQTQKQDKQNRRGLGRSIPELKITGSAGWDNLEAPLPPTLQGGPSQHPHPPTHTPVRSQLGLQSEKSGMLICCFHTGPQVWGHSQRKGKPTPAR